MPLSQIKDNYFNDKSPWLVFVKGAVAALALYFIYEQFQNAEVSVREVDWPDNSFTVIFLVLLLMPVNWCLEALRWKYSLASVEQLSLKNSLLIILTGLALNWVTPFSSGDLVSRLSRVKDKYQGTSAIVVNRGMMFVITLIFGLLSIHSYSTYLDLDKVLIVVMMLFVLIAVFVKLRPKLHKFTAYFRQTGRGRLIGIAVFSIVRYAVFSLQFVLLLQLFLPSLGILKLILGVGWIFFFRTMLPSLFGGAGVREASGLLFFSEVDSPMQVLIPTFLIWIINTLVPSLVGLLVITFWKSSSSD